MKTLSLWLQRFLPEPITIPRRERAFSALGATLAVLVVAVVSGSLLDTPVYLVAAIGASACILLCLPASPLAQPWPVLGGYLWSSLIGVAAAKTGWPAPLAGSLAVGAAVLVMLSLRCLHPPSGAVALIAVVGGDKITALGFNFVLTPVLSNALLLVGVALIINNLLPGRHYPRRLDAGHPHRGFTAQHLHAVLADYGHALAISEAELDNIITLAEQRAQKASPK